MSETKISIFSANLLAYANNREWADSCSVSTTHTKYEYEYKGPEYEYEQQYRGLSTSTWFQILWELARVQSHEYKGEYEY